MSAPGGSATALSVTGGAACSTTARMDPEKTYASSVNLWCPCQNDNTTRPPRGQRSSRHLIDGRPIGSKKVWYMALRRLRAPGISSSVA